MPRRSPSICTYPGCNALVRGGSRCPKHPYDKPNHSERQYRREKERARAKSRRADPESTQHFYNSRRWRRLAKWVLNADPMCAECKRNSRRTAAQVVDHIVPISAGGESFDTENLQPLCIPCHTAKTNRERTLR